MNNHRYAFLISSDEIMFLRMEIKEVTLEVNNTSTPVYHEPWLHYSNPMKISDAFDADSKSITTRMGIFYLLWLCTQSENTWRLPDGMGNSLVYAQWTDNGDELEPKRPVAPAQPGQLARTDSMAAIHR